MFQEGPEGKGRGIKVANVARPRISDRDALMALYRSTGGPGWSRRDNWGTNAPLQDWWGVIVDGGGRVVALDLEDNNLTGTIPPELGSLSNLEMLKLHTNNLTGGIPPELDGLVSLKRLGLGGNKLTDTIAIELGGFSEDGYWHKGNRLTELGNRVRAATESIIRKERTRMIVCWSLATLVLMILGRSEQLSPQVLLDVLLLAYYVCIVCGASYTVRFCLYRRCRMALERSGKMDDIQPHGGTEVLVRVLIYVIWIPAFLWGLGPWLEGITKLGAVMLTFLALFAGTEYTRKEAREPGYVRNRISGEIK